MLAYQSASEVLPHCSTCQLINSLCVITLVCLWTLGHICWHHDPGLCERGCSVLMETLLLMWWVASEVDLLSQVVTLFHFLRPCYGFPEQLCTCYSCAYGWDFSCLHQHSRFSHYDFISFIVSVPHSDDLSFFRCFCRKAIQSSLS